MVRSVPTGTSTSGARTLMPVERGLLAEMTDGTSDLFVPYLSYIRRTYLARNFRSLDDISVFAIGVFSGVGRDAGAQS